MPGRAHHKSFFGFVVPEPWSETVWASTAASSAMPAQRSMVCCCRTAGSAERAPLALENAKGMGAGKELHDVMSGWRYGTHRDGRRKKKKLGGDV